MDFTAYSLLYVPEGKVYSVAFFTMVDQTRTYSLEEIKYSLFFSVSNKDQILYIAPDFFSQDELSRLFIPILPEEVDIA